MLNFDISELVNIDASHRPNPLRTSILPCKAMAYSHKSILGLKKVSRGCILVLLKSHLRANRPNPNITGLDGSCIRWMKTNDSIHAVAVPSSV